MLYILALNIFSKYLIRFAIFDVFVTLVFDLKVTYINFKYKTIPYLVPTNVTFVLLPTLLGYGNVGKRCSRTPIIRTNKNQTFSSGKCV